MHISAGIKRVDQTNPLQRIFEIIFGSIILWGKSWKLFNAFTKNQNTIRNRLAVSYDITK